MAASRFSRLMHRVHRALGALLALLIATWFVSGAVMTFAGFPRLNDDERRALSVPLPSGATLAVPEPLARFMSGGGLARGASVRLTVLEGVPTWLYADKGVHVALRAREAFEVLPLDDGRVRTEAARRLGLPVASAERQTESDQWTVAFARAGVLPLYRVQFADLAHTQAYFSERTGELLQLSTRRERALAWVGAIPHWIYPTVLRRERALWRYTVLVLSALGLVLTLSGTAAGIHVWRTLKKRRAPPRDPYLRWHQALGLWFGLFASTWLFSGALSLNPFRWTSERGDGAHESWALYGAPSSVSAPVIVAALERCQRELSVHELELTPMAGRLYAVCSDAGLQTRLVDLADAQLRVRRALTTAELETLAARLSEPAPLASPVGASLDGARRARTHAATPHSLVLAHTFDAYHYPTHDSPDAALPYARVALQDEDRTTYYVDPARAQLLRKYTSRTRLERWLFQGLHCFDISPLYERRALWRTLMLGAMLLGAALSGLGLVMTCRRWWRGALRRRRRRARSVRVVTSAASASVAEPTERG